LETIRKNWLVNLSSVNILQDIQCLLQLGENFSVPPLNKKKITIDLIKSVECNTQKFDIDRQLNHRNRAITIINNLPSISPTNNSTNQRLTKLMKSCKSFINNNPADKGNTTVVLNRLEYINRIKAMLQDTNTYTEITRHPTRKMINDLRILLTRWKNPNYISASKYKSLYCSDGILPRVYGLPKIHKPENSFKIIISSIDSLLYSLSSFLQKLLTEHISNTFSHVEN